MPWATLGQSDHGFILMSMGNEGFYLGFTIKLLTRGGWRKVAVTLCHSNKEKPVLPYYYIVKREWGKDNWEAERGKKKGKGKGERGKG